MKRVLVIGANSYIGKKFYEYVRSAQISEIAVDLVSASDNSWEKEDLSLYDTVLHLSAIVHKKEKRNMNDLYEEVNHRLPVKVASKAKACKVKQFIFISTIAVYGDAVRCITNETIPQPTTMYGKMKLAAEEDLLQLENSNFKIAIIRSPMVYGIGCKGNYEKLRKLALITPIFPNYHNKRSWIQIDKLIRYLIDIILNEYNGKIIPQDEKYSDICELVISFRKEVGKKTYLISTFNHVICFMINKSRIISKMFGDLYICINEP